MERDFSKAKVVVRWLSDLKQRFVNVKVKPVELARSGWPHGKFESQSQPWVISSYSRIRRKTFSDNDIQGWRSTEPRSITASKLVVGAMSDHEATSFLNFGSSTTYWIWKLWERLFEKFLKIRMINANSEIAEKARYIAPNAENLTVEICSVLSSILSPGWHPNLVNGLCPRTRSSSFL